MKTIKIILAILLLATPVKAQENKILTKVQFSTQQTTDWLIVLSFSGNRYWIENVYVKKIKGEKITKKDIKSIIENNKQQHGLAGIYTPKISNIIELGSES